MKPDWGAGQVLFKANWCLYVGTCNPEASTEPFLQLRELLLNNAMQKHETRRKVDDSSALENSCKNLIKISFVTLPLWQIVTSNSKFRLSGCKSAIESSLKNFLCNSRKNMWRKTLNPPQMWFHTNKRNIGKVDVYYAKRGQVATDLIDKVI